MIARIADSSAAPAAAARRAARLEAQHVLWDVSSLDRIKMCGFRTAANASGVQLRVSADSSGARHGGFAGLQTCGSVWACPVCSATILAERQREIALAVQTWLDRGGAVGFATFTVKHSAKHSAVEVWDAVQAGHHAITSGRAHTAEKAALGVEVSRETITTCPAKTCGTDTAHGRRHAKFCKIGTDKVKHVLPWLRLVEVTTGDAGWHVHQHMLVFLPPGTDLDSAEDLYDDWHGRWVDGAASVGLHGSLKVNRIELIDSAKALADYFTKNTYGGPGVVTEKALKASKAAAGTSLGFELARGDLKQARFGNRNAMELLRDVVADPRRTDLALWIEFEQASVGRRQMTWAHGARLLLALTEEERTDEEIADEETGTADDAVAVIPTSVYRAQVARRRRRAALLEAVERSTSEALALLDAWGVEWMPPDEARQMAGRNVVRRTG